jgi:hypothetical protein
VDDDVRLRLVERLLRNAVVGEIAPASLERMDLVSSLPVTQLLHERAPDEAGGSRDEDSHRGRVYWRACALLGAALLVGGCHGSKRAEPKPPPKPPAKLTFRELDAQQQRLVADYEPVSRALTAYEIAYRDRRALAAQTRAFQPVVRNALARLLDDPASGPTARAKALLVAALEARLRALHAPPASAGYVRDWNRSVVDARRALTLLQDIRDRARLIPLPEDSIS